MRPYPPFSGNVSVEELSMRVAEISRVLTGMLGFGDPAGATPNGITDNLFGSWVEATFSPTQAGTDVTFTHNMAIQTVGATTPNVRWLEFGLQNAGGALPAGTVVQLRYAGGAITEDAITLKAYSNNAPGGATVKATLFFIPASG